MVDVGRMAEEVVGVVASLERLLLSQRGGETKLRDALRLGS